MRQGIHRTNRVLLELLHREVKGPFRPSEAAEILGLDLGRARRFLSYLGARGWLSRVRRGLYTTVPLGAERPTDWREDPWVVAHSVFSPCYVGGWSACEHWSLTEQVFRDVVVVTSRPARAARVVVQGTSFVLKMRKKAKLFGTRSVWRGRLRVQVSDPTRTIVDILDDPGLGGGIRHVSLVLEAYLEGEHRDESRLVEYATRLGNRTVFKRLGYLVEAMKIEALELSARCRASMSTGLTFLDPTLRAKGTIDKRWNLRVNARISSEARS
jgi:predicted transcriptional regulator of viral defense system